VWNAQRGKYLGVAYDQLSYMSRFGVLSVLLAFLLVLLAIPAGVAQNTSQTNLTPPGTELINVSPVVQLSGSNGISIADATDINYSAYDSYYGTSPHVSVVTAQLFLNGKPYHRSDIPVTFTSDNDSVAVLEPLDRTRPSDSHGQAKILLISNNTKGIVNITASSRISFSHEVKDSCTVYVVGWGTVSGVVTDKNKNGVPDAKVTLWVWNGTANIGIIDTPDNPQLTNDGSTAAIGTYTFSRVPVGVYNLTAEKDGHVYFAMVYMNVGTYTANVAFPDYVFPGLILPTTPTPTVVTPVTSPTESPSPSATPASGLSIPGMSAGVALISIFGALVVLMLRK